MNLCSGTAVLSIRNTDIKTSAGFPGSSKTYGVLHLSLIHISSASEVFTGAMKDYGRATVVGTKTLGKGIVQNLIPLDNGTAIKLSLIHI